MSMSANLHDANRAEAVDIGTSGGVLKFWNADGCHLNIFMPMTTAQIVADAFNANQPKPATEEAAE